MKPALSTNLILDTTVSVIRTLGPEKATISNVAKELGVSHAALYRYFETKADLWRAVTQRWMDELNQQAIEIFESDLAADQKLFELLVEYSNAKHRVATTDSEMYKNYIALAMKSKEVVNQSIEAAIQTILQVIEQGITEGIFSSENSLDSAKAVYYAQSCFIHPNPHIINDRDQVVINVAKLQVNGLRK